MEAATDDDGGAADDDGDLRHKPKHKRCQIDKDDVGGAAGGRARQRRFCGAAGKRYVEATAGDGSAWGGRGKELVVARQRWVVARQEAKAHKM